MTYEHISCTETIPADSDEDNNFDAQVYVGWYAEREEQDFLPAVVATHSGAISAILSGASSELSGDVQPVVASESNDLSNVTRRLILGRGNHYSDVKAPFLPAFMDKVRPQLFVFMFLCE